MNWKYARKISSQFAHSELNFKIFILYIMYWYMCIRDLCNFINMNFHAQENSVNTLLIMIYVSILTLCVHAGM